MATKLILPQHVKLTTLLRSGVRAKFSNGERVSINFLNVTLCLSKAKVNITIYLNILMFTPEQHWLENKRLRPKEILQASLFFFLPLSKQQGRLSVRLCGDFGPPFEAKRKVFNLIFNFNPLKYVSDLETYKLNLAEDPTRRNKAISFNFAITKEFKAVHLNYLDTSATSCNLLILKVPLSTNV